MDLKGKAIVFLGDGMADLPIPELGGKTPLEAVDTPAMDRIAELGASGTFLTLPDGFPTSSDVANMSVLGYSPALYYPGRGPIEAINRGIELADTDIAWRCNLVTVENGKMQDYSAGHIHQDDAKRIMNEIQQKFGNDKVTFYSGVSYRNLMILHGAEFSADVGYSKPDSSFGMDLEEIQWYPLNSTPAAIHTTEYLKTLTKKVGEFLSEHPLVKSGQVKANAIWPWSPGKTPHFPKFKELYAGKTAAVITAVDVIAGIAKCADMDIIDVEGATGYIDTNFEGKADAAIREIETHDFVYVHVEAIDETGHEGRLDLKCQAIRDFDTRLVHRVMTALEGRGVTFAVLPDHPVPISMRKHTTTPVPFSVCGPNILPDQVKTYGENAAKNGALGYLTGDALIRLVLGL